MAYGLKACSCHPLMWTSCINDWESKGPEDLSTAQFVTLSGDQNEVFKYLVLQSLLFTAYFRKSNGQKIFFFFNIWILWFDYCVY